MKIRLKTGFCEGKNYQLDVRAGLLMFRSGEEEVQIPLSAISRVSLAGLDGRTDHLTLETADRLYEGRLLCPEDSTELMTQLRKQLSCEMELQMIPRKRDTA